MSQTQVQLVGNVVSGAVFTGIVTANSSINVADVVGINSTGINVSGAITATSFSGDGSALTGVGVGTEDSINTTGIITASSFSGDGSNLSFSPTITSFSPADGEIRVEPNTSIFISFNQQIYAGVGSVFLRNSSGIGTEIEAIGISSSMISNQTLIIDPSDLPDSTDIYVVLPEGVVTNSIGDGNALLDTYSFTTKIPQLGELYGGGNVMCLAGSTRWIVAPSSTEVTRVFADVNDAVTTANAYAACGDWFIPSVAQLQNPGYVCKQYWNDGVSVGGVYRSSAPGSGVLMSTGVPFPAPAGAGVKVRAFRCVSY